MEKRFYEEEVSEIEIFSKECSIEVSELTKFLDTLSDKVDARLHDQIGEYAISEERIRTLTGHTWDNIIELRSMMTSMRNSEVRNVIQALVIFLFKLRSGNSNNCIAAILGLEEKQVASSIDSVLNSFKNEVLPKHFGIDAFSREFFISHNPAKMLHNVDNDLDLFTPPKKQQ